MTTYVFNQYFLTFIKTVKKNARTLKEKKALARDTLNKIHAFYNTFDNKSNDYVNNYSSIFTDFITNTLVDCNKDEIEKWFEDNQDLHILQNIPLKNVKSIFKKTTILHQFILIFHLFKNTDLTEDNIKNIMEKLKGITIEDSLIPEKYRKIVNRIAELAIENKTGFSMEDIEDTSIGKLAKEIMEDVDIEKVKKSINTEGDILGALSDPDNGIGNLISDVSQKMATKLKSGELKQDALLKDALSMAGKLPGMSGGGGGGDGTPDIGNIMKMMSGMMGGGNMPSSRSVQRKMDKKTKLKKKLDSKNKE
tara:strand:- start:2524 stop:3447 length:924 start_codon:yes stop_codon:yes gene_type:complete